MLVHLLPTEFSPADHTTSPPLQTQGSGIHDFDENKSGRIQGKWGKTKAGAMQTKETKKGSEESWNKSITWKKLNLVTITSG